MKFYIIGNANKKLSKNIVKKLSVPHQENKKIVALDGTVNTLLNYDILPDFVIGDFDSISKNSNKNLSYIKNTFPKIQFIEIADQNQTDLEKALNYITNIKSLNVQKNVVEVHNALSGNRMDHTIYNIRLMKKFYNKIDKLEFYTLKEKLLYLKNQNIKIFGKEKSRVSVFAMYKATISSKGLYYEMNNFCLNKNTDSVSNSMKNLTAFLKIKGDALLILNQNISVVFD